MTGQDETRWIPIGALPLDLQLELLQTSSPVQTRRPRRPLDPPVWQRMVAMIAAGIATIHVLTVPEAGGFESFWRAGCLLLVAVLGARYLVWRRMNGFRAEQGRQMILGPASLVIVDGRSAQVIPAESLLLVMDEIKRGDEIVARLDARSVGASDWIERLRRVIGEAQARPELRDEDRYRRAAPGSRRMSSFDVLWSRHEASIVPLGLAISAAVFLEAGPLHARAERAKATRVEASAIQQRMGLLREARKRDLQAVKKHVEGVEARRKRERLLESALAGDSTDARNFLAEYGPGDEARPRLQQKLREACETLVPEKPAFLPKARLLQAVARSACQSPKLTLYFTATGDRNVTAAARDVLKELVRSEAASLPVKVWDVKAIADEPGSEVYPHVRVVMTEAPGRQAWKIELTPVDVQGQPVKDAGFTTIQR